MNYPVPPFSRLSLAKMILCLAALLPTLIFAGVLPQSGMVLHLDVASLSGLSDGDPVSTGWADESGLGNNALPGAASNQPMYVADAGSGYPAVRFDGVDDYLEVAGLSTGPQASVFIVFSHRRADPPVGKRDTLVSTFTGSSGIHLSSSRYVASAPAPDYPSFNERDAATTTVDTWANGWHRDEVTGDILKDRFYVGSAVYTGVSPKTNLWIGARDNTGAGAGQNDIREVIVYNRALSASERRDVQRYLGLKYDIELIWRPLGHPVEEFPHILGSQQFGTQYSFGELGIRGVDYANATYRQGSRVIKMRLSGKYANTDGFTDYGAAINTLTELVRDQPEIKAILDGPGTDYLFWVSSFAYPSWQNQLDATGLKPSVQTAIYNEVRALAEYLLTTYSGTGKSFYLGNWEGDWMLAGQGDTDPSDTPPERIQGMIDWATVRQQAIDDAKATVSYSDVNLWFYLEMNKADWMRDGEICVANTIIPALSKLDFISISAYSLHTDNGSLAPISRINSDLDMVQALIDAKPDPSIPGSRIIIGEYGYQYSSGNFANFTEFAQAHLDTARALMNWPGGTLRFIHQWQFFNEEKTDGGVPKEMCQISNTNAIRPLYYLNENFTRSMRRYVDDVYFRTGSLPTVAEYEAQAVQVLDDLSLEEYIPVLSFTQYEQWRAFHFPDFLERGNDLISGELADPNGSGLENLLRYAYGMGRYDSPAGYAPHLRLAFGNLVYVIPYDPAKTDLTLTGWAGEDLDTWPYEVFNSATTSLVPVEGWVEVDDGGLANPNNPVFYRLQVDYAGPIVYAENFDPAPPSQSTFSVSLGGDFPTSIDANNKEVVIGEWGITSVGSFGGGVLQPMATLGTNAKLAGVFLDSTILDKGAGNYFLKFDIIGDPDAPGDDSSYIYVSSGSGYNASSFLVLDLSNGGFSGGAWEPLSATGTATASPLASIGFTDTTIDQPGVEIPFTYDGTSTISIAFGAYNSGIAFDNIEIHKQP